MSAAHHHHHAHSETGHHHGPANYDRAFAIGIALNLAFVILEAAMGFIAGSLALVADAGHNLSDVLGLVLAWGGAWLGRRAPTARRTYGYRRATILASLANAVILLIVSGGIAWEAARRFAAPQPVAETTVLWVAAVGIAVNTATALLFMSGRKHDLNLRGAYLHMAADAAVSAGVVVAALLIMATGWTWLDPAVGLLVVAVIAVGTWDLLAASLDLAMDAVPRGLDRDAVEGCLAALPGVAEVHDVHIWAMSTTETALTAHLVCPAGGSDALLAEAGRILHDSFGIEHPTLQIETGALACRLAPREVV